MDKALLLLYLEEKKYKEISEIIGLSETNVATKIGRIKKLLNKNSQLLKINNNGKFRYNQSLENAGRQN